MIKAKKFILTKHFDGAPKVTNFKLVEELLPELKENGKSQLIVAIKYNSHFIKLCNRDFTGGHILERRSLHATLCGKNDKGR